MADESKTSDWEMIGIWRALTWFAVLDVIITVALVIHAGASLEVIAITVMACATGAAMMAALAFWARDRWLSYQGVIHDYQNR